MKSTLLIILSMALVACGSKDAFKRGEPTTDGFSSAETDSGPNTGTAVELSKIQFEQNVLPVLVVSCDKCHDNPAPTFEVAKTMVVLGKPDESPLLQIALGQGHSKRWELDSAEAAVLKAWIMGEKANPAAPVIEVPVAVELTNGIETAVTEGEQFFEQSVKPLLAKSCTKCHDGRDQYAEAKSLIEAKAPDKSQLYTRASGVKHKKVFAPGSVELAAIKSWIELEN